MLGTQLGPYDIIEEIGRGGMAAVYRAHQRSIDRDVAIKIIQRGVATSPDAVMRFQREARVIARLEHPHILPVYDFDGGSDPPYIVMRFLDGGTLKEIISTHALPVEEVTYMMGQVCAALDYAHRQGVIHRDIKPSNVMIDREGNAFVSDFGIARMTGTDSNDATGSGAILGTPDYMSPEQSLGEGNIDSRTDIYSLGVMTFQMLTGRLPYLSDTPLGVLMQHIHEPVPDMRDYNEEMPREVSMVVRKAMAKERADRYETVAAYSADLIEALGGSIARIPVALRAAAQESIALREADAVVDHTPHTDSQNTPGEQNKSITALYANAAEYAQIVDEMQGPEATRRAMTALWNAADRIIGDRHGLIISQTETDLLALWGAENTAEDDAEQAVNCALDLHNALHDLGWAIFEDESDDELLPINIGINTGMALLVREKETADLSVSGATISLANRLAQASNGLILISHDTFREVRGVFDMYPEQPLRLRGRKDPVEVYRVEAAKARAFRVNTRGVEGVETAMVGRDAEMKQLQYAFLDAVEEGETQLVTVISEAGLGKSRLFYEFDQWTEFNEEYYRIFQGRSTAAMTSRPYSLMRGIFAHRFELTDADSPAELRRKLEEGVETLLHSPDDEMAHMIGHLCGFDLGDSPHIAGLRDDPAQLSARARQLAIRFFTTLGTIQTSIMSLEDTHHADDASLDLINELVTLHPDLKLLVIVLARPSLLERRPDWGSGHRAYRLLTLNPLDRRESRDLVREILQNCDEVPRDLRDLIVEQGEGNPFYIEELVKMLIEDRVIIKESDTRWRVEESRLEHLRVPPTLVSLLQARFDSLLYPEKLALQRAAVIGRVFYDTAIAALDLSDGQRLDDLHGILERLHEREFIFRRETSTFQGATEYIFGQNMLRDQIYESLLDRHRTAYHAATAEWLETLGMGRAEEYIPVIAEHYEAAGQPKRAAIYMQGAGERALDLGALGVARRMLEHAYRLMPDDDIAGSLAIELLLADALTKIGEGGRSAEVLEAAQNHAASLNDRAGEARALYLLSQVDNSQGQWEAAREKLLEALPLAREDGGQTALAWTLYGLSDTLMRTGDLDEARAYGEEALALAREKSIGVVERAALNRLGTINLGGGATDNEYFEEGIAQLEECLALSKASGDLRAAQGATNNLGYAYAMQGDSEKSIERTLEGLRIGRENDDWQGICVSAGNLSQEYVVSGDLEQAWSYAYEMLRQAHRANSDAWMLSSLNNFGFIYLAEGDIEKGLAYCGKAVLDPTASSDSRFDFEMRWPQILGDKYTRDQVEQMIEAGRSLDKDKVLAGLLKKAESAPSPSLK